MEKLTGRIIRVMVYSTNGKEKQSQYFIETGPGQRRRIVVDGEHPTEQPTLHTLFGRRCQVEGENYQGKFMVSKENIKPFRQLISPVKK